MNLYLLSQVVNRDYDTFDACVVAATSEEEARTILPIEGTSIEHTWAPPDEVFVELLGNAKPGTPSGVILASFNAG